MRRARLYPTCSSNAKPPPSRSRTLAGPRDVPLLELTIGEGLRRTVERFGDREALVVRDQGYRATYRELWDEVGLAARGLLARGVRTGDRVGIWAPNRHEWLVIQYATARIGAILVTINPAYKAAELRVRADQDRREPARPRARLPPGRLRGDARRGAPALPAAARDGRPRGRLGRTCSPTARAWPRPTWPRSRRRCDPDDPINVQFTSGTTGAPKGATLSHRNILNNGYFTGLILRYTEHDRVCVPVPFYHCFGMVLANLACLTHGACLVVPGANFDPLATLQAVAGGALHLALRRADDVHRRARASALRRASTSPACAPGSWPARPARWRS